MDINGQRVGIIGAAKSGLASARCLATLGAKVLLSDQQPWASIEKRIVEAALPASVEIETGRHSERILSSNFIVISPGVPLCTPIIKQAQEIGIPIISEIELGFRLSKGRRLVVTGSNGKTTTTTLLSLLCSAAFPRVFLGGNIGIPVMEFALETKANDLQVLEVSSFQLETISEFTPDIAIITNFFPNHLDRYSTFEDYCKAKERISLNMNQNHWIVLNSNQPAMKLLSERVNCKTAWFGWDIQERFPAVTIVDGFFVFRQNKNNEKKLFEDKKVRIIGRHNRENIMAACLAAVLVGVPPMALGGVVGEFPGVEHRLEWVRTWKGIDFINDSKGTNCAASIIAMRAGDSPIILIAGGRDKGTNLSDWVTAIREKAKGVVLIGEAKDRFRVALEGLVPLRVALSFEEAVQMAANWALPGETVLLSPACSSYDMFPNFEERGKYFKKLVNELL